MVGSGQKIRAPAKNWRGKNVFLFALAAYDLTCSLLSQRLDRATSISKVECHIVDRFCAILWCSVKTLSARRGQFSNDDGDSNENVKKVIGLHSKQKTTLHVHHSFCTFLCRHCTTTTWKCVIFRFMEVVNKRRWIFLSLSKLECGPQKINSREIRLHLTFSATWN